jgi:hypothetical protein
VISDSAKTASKAFLLRRQCFATNERIASLSKRLFTGVWIARAAAAIVSAPPEGLFFHCANRSEAAAMPSS